MEGQTVANHNLATFSRYLMTHFENFGTVYLELSKKKDFALKHKGHGGLSQKCERSETLGGEKQRPKNDFSGND